MSNEYIKGINEAEFCFNKCWYHNHETNYCHYLECSINDIESCDYIYYDTHSRKLIINYRVTQKEKDD